MEHSESLHSEVDTQHLNSKVCRNICLGAPLCFFVPVHCLLSAGRMFSKFRSKSKWSKENGFAQWVWKHIGYIGVAFAVKVECKSVARLFGCSPYKYMGRYCPKEGKNREKVKFLLQEVFDLLCVYCKMW